MAARNNDVTKTDDIQKKWLLMKETWLKCSKQVRGITKCPPQHKRLGGGIEMWKRWLPNEMYV